MIQCAINKGFLGGSDGKDSAFNARDLGLIPRLGRSPGEESNYPLYYSCLENSMEFSEKPAGLYSPWGCTELDTTEQLTLSLSIGVLIANKM